MDKINKFLLRLTKKERQIFFKLFADIRALNLKKHDIKPLKGIKGVYRLRKGKIRIIFTKNKTKGIILNIGFRKDIYS